MCKVFIIKHANILSPLQAYDVLVTSRQSGKAWTVHSQGCAHPGSHIVLPLDAILEYGMDEEDFVTQRWTDEIRTTPIRVMVKGALLRLMPALKIEAKLPPNKVRIPCC